MVRLDDDSRGWQVLGSKLSAGRFMIGTVAAVCWICFAVEEIVLERRIVLAKVMPQAQQSRDIAGVE